MIEPIVHDINLMKLKKIDALLHATSDKLLCDLNEMEKGSLDHLQMQIFLMGFHQCLTLATGIIYD
jgi:hypothetical protein